MKILNLRWMAAALTAALCLTVLLVFQSHPAQAQAINCADTATTGIPQAECEALTALFPERTANVSPCQWSEVTCAGGYITELDFTETGIGTTMPDLSGLTHLETLIVFRCDLSGAFPSWIAASSTLKFVDLTENYFSGLLPDLSAMTSLETLWISRNGFSGAFPDISSLTSLQELHIGENQFTGLLPDISMLPNLRMFWAGPNNFTGTIHSGITNSTSLEWLLLHYNNLSGPLPDLRSMTALVHFNASNNDLVGDLPSTPPFPPGITAIALSANHFTGSIPASYTELPLLEHLILDQNMLTGEVPVTYEGDLGYLAYNALTASAPLIPSEWFLNTQTVPPTNAAASNVTHNSADLSWTPILYTADAGAYEVGLSTTSGSGYTFNRTTANKSASSITLNGLTPGTTYYAVIRTVTQPHANNPNTVTSLNSAEFTFTTGFDPNVLNCANTAMTGIPQAECAALTAVFPERTTNVSPCQWSEVTCAGGYITGLDFTETGIGNTMPDLSGLTYLETLIVFRNGLSGEFPAWIAASATLKNVDLTENMFSGPLPDLSAMTSLVQLNINRNGFSGPLPDFSALTSLELLGIGDNDFTGPLPNISMLPNFKVLWASDNDLSGGIHSGITTSASLELLMLDLNDLSGPVPDLSGMTALWMFNVRDNDLSGDLPPVSYLPSGLQYLDLARNHFTGQIPIGYSELSSSYSTHIDLGSNMLTGEVPYSPTGSIGAFYNAVTDASLDPSDPFYGTQTLPPTGISASNVTHNSANLAWTPIAYTSNTGAYEIGLSTTSGSGYIFSHSTANKSASSIALSGLTPGTTYYAVVRTVTQPHADNPNTVTSLNSAEFSFTTGFDPNVLNCADTATTGIPQAECAALVAEIYPYLPEAEQDLLPCEISTIICEDGHVQKVLNSIEFLQATTIPDLSVLTHLEAFVFHCECPGSFPAWVAASPKLKIVNLRWNNLSGAVPDLSAMISLEELDLMFNAFSGPLPDISALPNLRTLSLGANNFSGPIHAGITSSTTLELLDLTTNALSGTIPDMSSMSSLSVFGAANNQFSGALPKLPPSIVSIRAPLNSFSGEIPVSYGDLPMLSTIALSGNALTGDVPSNLINTVILDLSYNALTATDPALNAWLANQSSGYPDFFDTQTVPPTGVAVSNVTSVSADLSWTPIAYTADAGLYEIGISTTSGSGYAFSHVTADKLASGINLSGLTPSTTYYAVIRTVTLPHGVQPPGELVNWFTTDNPNTVTSLNSAEISFTTLIDLVSAPVLLSPAANGAVRGTNSPVLSWLPNPAGEGVTAYQVLLTNNATGAKILKQTFPAAMCAAVCTVDLSSFAPQIDLAIGVYNWQVTATGSLGTTKSLKQRFSVVKPDAPVITAPLGTASHPQPDLTWTVNPDDMNTSYKLKLVGVKSGVVFKKTVTGACSGAACAIGLDVLAGGPYLLKNDTYTLSIKAVNEIGGRKATGTFKVKFPAPAVNLAPAGGVIVNTPHPVLSWMPDPNASSFRVILQQIKNGAVVKTFRISDIVNGTQGFVCSAGTCTLDLAALESPLVLPKENYAWTIVSSNPAIQPTSSSKSAKAKFKIVLP